MPVEFAKAAHWKGVRQLEQDLPSGPARPLCKRCVPKHTMAADVPFELEPASTGEREPLALDGQPCHPPRQKDG